MRIENGIVVFGNPDRETIGQIRQVYERAERAVLCADSHVGYIMPIGGVAAYRDKVSVAGVGFDIACIARGSLVTTADGYSLPIERVLPHHPISLWDGFNSRPALAHSGHVLTGRRPTLRLRLSNGRLLELTPDHQVLTLEGWKEAGQLGPEDRVACNPFVGMPYEEPSGSIPMPAEGRDLGLPHEAKDPRLAPLLRSMGFLCGDGHLSADGKRASWYAYHPHDAQSLQHDLARLGLQPRVHRRLRPNTRREEFRVYIDSTTLHRALRGLGVPGGKKAWPADPMPWLFALPGWLRAQFLSSFCSAGMSTPRVGKSGTIPNLQVKQVGHDDASSRFLARLLASLGFEASVVTTERSANGRAGYSTQVLGGQEAQLRFLETVGFCYSLERRAAAARVASIAWESQRLVRKREAARDQARSLKAQGVHWREIIRQVSQAYGVPEGFVYHAIYGTRGKPRLSTTAKPQPNHSGEICWLSIESVEAGRETCVYDIATQDPAHCFYAQGVVVHNCGNAAIRTDLRLEHIQPHLETLADEIAGTISFGIGRSNKSDDAPVNDPLFEDAAWEAIPGRGEREALREKARAQLGTVGSGNHYVDVFAEVSGPAGRGSDALDEQDRVWVGVHFGSRGLGHTVASGFMALSQNRPWGSRGAEVEALLDLSSELGRGYWALMNLAGRYAYVGREWVARKVVQILGGKELELVHNHHNFCIPANAIVPTPIGPQQMSRLKAGDCVYAFDSEKGWVEATITAHWLSGRKPTRTIRTANRSLEVSPEHPILTVQLHHEPHPTRSWHIKRRGELVWKTAAEITKGEIIVCAENYYSQNHSIGLGKARLIGAMLGDGWVRHNPKVQGYTVGLAIGTAEEAHTWRYKALLESELPAEWRVDRKGAYGLTCSSVKVWRALEQLGLTRSSNDKRLPPGAFTLSREEKLAMLAGYMDADGSVAGQNTSNYGRGTIASTNQRLVEELRELAIGCGLRVTPVIQSEAKTNFGTARVYRCRLSANSTAQLELWHQGKAANQRVTRYPRHHGLAADKIGYVPLPPGTFAQRVISISENLEPQAVFDLMVNHPSHAFICEGVVVHNCWKETHGGEELYVVRKGATPAFPGQKGFVGGSMGDDAVILQGTPNPDPETRALQEAALFSTVHGAGRVMSRRQALGKVDRKTGKILQPGQVTPGAMKKWLKEKGVTLRGGGLDESPHVYRRLPEVLEAQGNTIQVLHTLRPLIVVMAGANEFDPYKD